MKALKEIYDDHREDILAGLLLAVVFGTMAYFGYGFFQ